MRANGIPVLLLAGTALAVGGCVRAGPPVRDTTLPRLVLTALGGVGMPTFASDERGQPSDACAKFNSFPARFLLSVGDDGGVAMATVKAGFGRIVRESVNVGPASPESSWEIARDGPNDHLTIRLRPPAAGTVRTGLLVMFDVTPDTTPVVAVLADALDYAGNRGGIFQVDARLTSETAVICR